MKSAPASTLLLQVLQVVVEARRLGVPLGVARHADAEAVQLADEGDQLVGEPEAPRGPHEFLLALGRVAAQGQDVLDVVLFHLLDNAGDVVPRRGHTGQVGEGLAAELVFHARGDLDRLVPRPAAGAVGHGDEIGLELLQLGDGLEQALQVSFPHGREDLEGERSLFLTEQIPDQHVRLLRKLHV